MFYAAFYYQILCVCGGGDFYPAFRIRIRTESGLDPYSIGPRIRIWIGNPDPTPGRQTWPFRKGKKGRNFMFEESERPFVGDNGDI
jgi:hypothetical protein